MSLIDKIKNSLPTLTKHLEKKFAPKGSELEAAMEKALEVTGNDVVNLSSSQKKPISFGLPNGEYPTTLPTLRDTPTELVPPEIPKK